MSSRPRARDLGLPFPGTTGPYNAITDIADLWVGSKTIRRDQVATGVTAIVPRGPDDEMQPVWAGFHALNGNGEMTGTHWIEDAGYFCGPILITNTHAVGIVHHAAVRWMIRRYPNRFTADHTWAMPIVAETYDGTLSDINGLHVGESDALAALDAAKPGAVAEGNCGGGTGMICYGYKGGTGTSSRVIEVAGQHGTVAALVQANHGRQPLFTLLGVPVGEHVKTAFAGRKELGSIIVVIATDLPVLPHQLRRIAKRATIGIGRHGTQGGNGSGDIFLAISTANPMPVPQRGPDLWKLDGINDEHFDPIYLAAVQAIEEAVVNAMLAAEPMPTFRPAGHVCEPLDSDKLVAVMKRFGRM